MKKKKNFIQVFLEVIFWLVFAFVIGFLSFVSLSNRKYDLKYRAFLIQSGSMEPSIMTGDVVVITSVPSYKKNDVITYYDHADRIVTHRILKVEGEGSAQRLITKGDANEDSDISPQSVDKVIGKVVLVLPKLGYLVAFSKGKVGLFFLVLVPVILIIYDEIGNIIREVKKS